MTTVTTATTTVIFKADLYHQMCGDTLSHSLLPSSGPMSHLHLLYFGMCIKKLLYLSRVDVLPSSDDHVLYASNNAAVSEVVQVGHVSAHR